MISELYIKNMRIFSSIKIDNIGKITLISGENNVGKSTLLESLFLLFAYSSPDLFAKSNSIRGLLPFTFAPELLWESLFHNIDLDQELEISCKDGNVYRTVIFKKDESFSVTSMPQISSSQKLHEIPLGYPLRITYKENDTTIVGHVIPLVEGLTTRWENKPLQNKPVVQYISPRFSENVNVIAQIFGRVELLGKKDKLLEMVRKFDSEIVDISIIIINNIANLYAKKKNNKLLPLFAMGDGINRLLMILCSILEEQCKILLIDEIENGFHHSFYHKLWEIIDQVVAGKNIQVFATTHSYECMQGAESVAKKYNDDRSLFEYIRLGRKNDEIVPYLFSSESFIYAIKSEMEIR